MSFVRDFLCRHGVDLVGKLVHSGFSNGEAQRFLKETPEQVLKVLSRPECSSASQEKVIEDLDIIDLAAKADIEPSMANTGLKALIPALIAYFRESQSGWQSDVRFPTIH